MATPHTRLREALPRASEAALLCAVRAGAGIAAYASGFRALSDDDYARITIAQRFAESPSLDPSHSSWLPAPFWLYGAAVRAFGTDLAVARATAALLGVAATLAVYLAARLLGACRPGALLGAAASALVPYSALLGIAAVPEVPCAALILVGAATLATRLPSVRAFGGLALGVACLARYEAWPVAAVFTAFGLRDAMKERAFASSAALALLGPAAWLLLGRVEHGDALFFVARVASYKRALGAAPAESVAARLLEYPALLLRAEPAVCGVSLVVSIGAWRFGDREDRAPYFRPAVALSALLLFMMLGSVRDGVPTHHAARVLLPLWFFGCVVSGHSLAHLAARAAGWPRALVLGLAFAAALFGSWLRPRLVPTEGFAERRLELAVGSEAKRQGVAPLAIDTPDYGYLAVQAAFGSPSRSFPLDDHDPRHVRPSDPFATDASLERALAEHHAHFLVATREHAAAARKCCTERWQNAGFSLLECAGPATVSAALR